MNLSTKSSNTITRINDEERLPRLVGFPPDRSGGAAIIDGPDSTKSKDICSKMVASSNAIKSLDKILQLFKLDAPGSAPDTISMKPFGSMIKHNKRRSKNFKRFSMPERSVLMEATKFCQSLDQLDLEDQPEEEEEEEEEANLKNETSGSIRLVDYSRGKARLETLKKQHLDLDSPISPLSLLPNNSDEEEEREMSLEEVFGLKEPNTAKNVKYGQAKKLRLQRGCGNSSSFPAASAAFSAAALPTVESTKLGSSLSALDMFMKDMEDEENLIRTLPTVRFNVRRNKKMIESMVPPYPITNQSNKKQGKNTGAESTTTRNPRPTRTPQKDFSNSRRRRSIAGLHPLAFKATAQPTKMSVPESATLITNKLGCSLSALDLLLDNDDDFNNNSCEEEDDNDDNTMSMMAASMSDLGDVDDGC